MYFQTRPSIPDDQPNITEWITTTEPNELAFTGSSTMLLLLAAGVLIALGAAMYEASKNPRRYGS